jgi:integrase
MVLQMRSNPDDDLLRREITINRQLVSGMQTILGPVKTESSHRTIPVPGLVVDTLSQHLTTYSPGPDGLIFTTADGTPLARNRAGRLWRAAADKAGLPRDTSWHALRHHYASLLIAGGESVKVVQARLGHKSASITLDTYSHLWPSDDERTREVVGAALDRLADIPRTSQVAV